MGLDLENIKNIKDFSTQIFLLHSEYSKVWRKYATADGMYSGQERIYFGMVDYKADTLNELSKVTGIGVSSLSVSISNMEKNGDVRKVVDPTDKRIYRIYPTEAGLNKFYNFTGAVDNLFLEFLNDFASLGNDSTKFMEELKLLTNFVGQKAID